MEEKISENGDLEGDKKKSENTQLPEPAENKKRTGRTREHYNKQKAQAFSYFKINSGDLGKMQELQYTIYDFISNSFAFSQTKKELTIKVLEELKKGECTFIELHKRLNAKKSTLYMLILALQRSGLITQAQKNEPLRISDSFSHTLHKYSEWWERWTKE